MKNRSILFFLLILFLVPKLTSAQEPINVDLFVRNKCSFSALAERALIKAKDIFGESLKINIYYIADYQDGKLVGMYGQAEIEEDMRQLIILKYFPKEFWDYLELINNSASDSNNWFGALIILGIDKDAIERLTREEGEKLLGENIKKSKDLNVGLSPTLYINNQLYEGKFDTASLILALCKNKGAATKELCVRLPECFTDEDCLSPGKEGQCIYSVGKQASCAIKDLPEVKGTLITSKECCRESDYGDTQQLVARRYRSISIKKLYIDDKEAQRLARQLDIEGLPVLIFDNSITSLKEFKEDSQAGILIKSGNDQYMLSNFVLPVKFLWKRPRIENSIQIFVMSHCPFSIGLEKQLIEKIKNKTINYKIDFHYVLRRENDLNIGSLHGKDELDEDLRQMIIKKYYSEKFLDYLLCRNTDIKNNNWQACAEGLSIDMAKVADKMIKEKDNLLLQELELSSALGIEASPVILWENNCKIKELGELKTKKGLEDLKKTKGQCK